jgi:hypothetical protein
MIGSTPQHVELAQRCKFNPNNDSVEGLDACSYVEPFETIADSESQPSPPTLPRTETHAGAGTPLCHYIAELYERNTHCGLETNIQTNSYYSFATRDEYKYIQRGIKKKVMKTHYDNVLREEITALHFPSFKNRHGVQRLVAIKQDDQALGEWELHTVEDMRWNDNRQCPNI